MVWILSDDVENGRRFVLAWCHCKAVNVSEGQHVSPQDVIGWGNTTGNAQGCHLHFMLCYTDTNGNRLDAGNGYNGWVDPMSNIQWQIGTQPTPAPAPTPPAPPPGTWTGSISADGGAHVRALPGTDQPVVPQPGSNPDVVDKGTILTFDAWCHHPPAIPDAISGQPDDRWFRTAGSGHWVASAMVNGNPPDELPEVPDPTAGQPTPTPAPAPTSQPVPPQNEPTPPDSRGLGALSGLGCWEGNESAPEADYNALKVRGYHWVAIRGLNGSGSGVDPQQEADWKDRAPKAKAAGLDAVLWVYWYGPSEGVTGDVALYLLQCADWTIKKLHESDFPAPVAVVVDVEDPLLAGLGPALSHLRNGAATPVAIAPPGNPISYGTGARKQPTDAAVPALKWDWPSLVGKVDAVLWQMYTSPGAWNGSPTLDGTLDAYSGVKEAYGEVRLLGGFFSDPARCAFVSDETDVSRIKEFVRATEELGIRSLSFWRWGEGDMRTLDAYAQYNLNSTPPSPPNAVAPPGPTPTPAPVAPVAPGPQTTTTESPQTLEEAWKHIQQLERWIERIRSFFHFL